MAVIIVNSVLGNIFHDEHLLKKYRKMIAARKCEMLPLSRVDMEHLRLKRKTDRGTNVGVILEPGAKLGDGDVLLDTRDKFIVVKQLPEKVISVSIQEKDAHRIAEVSAIVGHIIGNRHRPIAVSDNTITFPISADSELDVFSKLLPWDNVELKLEEKVFQPSGAIISDHAH
ncbi:MAG: urease accessory protein UreE [Nitrososphaera sp.]